MIRPPPGLCHCQTFSSPNVSILIIWDSQLRQHPVRGYCRLPHFRGTYILGIMTFWWHGIVGMFSLSAVICWLIRCQLLSNASYVLLEAYRRPHKTTVTRQSHLQLNIAENNGELAIEAASPPRLMTGVPREMVSDCLWHLYMSYPADYSRYIYFWVQCHFFLIRSKLGCPLFSISFRRPLLNRRTIILSLGHHA